MKWIVILMALVTALAGVYLHSQNVFEAAAAGNIYTLVSRANAEALEPNEGILSRYLHRVTALVREARTPEEEAMKVRLTDSGLHYLLRVRDRNGNTALHWAVRNREGDTMTYLLGLKTRCISDQDQKLYQNFTQTSNSRGSTALHWACQAGTAPMVDALIAAGIDVNVANESGETPLHWAVDWQNEAMVRTLLRNGASAIAVDKELNTPLHRIPKDCAQSNDCAMIVSLLLKAGADPEAENAYKRKAMQYFDMTHAPPPPNVEIIEGQQDTVVHYPEDTSAPSNEQAETRPTGTPSQKDAVHTTRTVEHPADMHPVVVPPHTHVVTKDDL